MSDEDERPPAEEPEYPPDTYRLMSWAAIRFIHRPHRREIAAAFMTVVAIVVASAIASFIVTIDARLETSGQVAAYPDLLAIQPGAGGRIASIHVPAGAKAAKDQVVATLESDLPEAAVKNTMDALRRNPPLAEGLSPEKGLDLRAEVGASLLNARDEGLRQAASELDAAARRLRAGRIRTESLEADRDRFIEASRTLWSLLEAHLEGRRVRAPAAGTVVQYNVGPGAHVRADQIIGSLLPEGAQLVVVMSLDPQEVPSVSVGQTVRHDVAAYPAQRYGLFEGKVLSIDQLGEKAAGEGGLRYQVLASIQPPERLERKGTARLVMGMTTNSQIITERRTVYEAAIDGFFGRKS